MTKEEALKVAKPILFNTEMVRAILGSTKTVTRRVLKTEKFIPADAEFGYTGFTPKGNISFRGTFIDRNGDKRFGESFIKLPYSVGDILYVRETWQYVDDIGDHIASYIYKAEGKYYSSQWRPSIHMPKEASRIFLRVKKISVERLQDSFFKSGSTIFTLLGEGVDIGEQCQECIDTYGSPCCIDDESECGTLDEMRSDYSDLWNSTVEKSDLDKYGWNANP